MINFHGLQNCRRTPFLSLQVHLLKVCPAACTKQMGNKQKRKVKNIRGELHSSLRVFTADVPYSQQTQHEPGTCHLTVGDTTCMWSCPGQNWYGCLVQEGGCTATVCLHLRSPKLLPKKRWFPSLACSPPPRRDLTREQL